MPSDVAPDATAFSAYSICMSLPVGLNVVSEKLYRALDMVADHGNGPAMCHACLPMPRRVMLGVFHADARSWCF